MTYQAAGYAGVAVVACKTEKGIIRACELGISDHEHPIKLGEIPR